MNTTIPYPAHPNKTLPDPGPSLQDQKIATGGKLFGKITSDMLTRGNTTTNVTDPEAYFINDVFPGMDRCVNGTVWNGTDCGNRTETNITFPI